MTIPLQQTRTEATITPTEPHNNDDQGLPGILILAIGIALAVGIIATIMLVLVVLIKQRRKRDIRRAQENDVSGKGKPAKHASRKVTAVVQVNKQTKRERELIKPT